MLGDFHLRSEITAAWYSGEEPVSGTVLTRDDAETDQPHWCLDAGAGLCRRPDTR